ncbi:MAG: hypothetical protein K9H16_08950 [Bacteroidales bacterium]|nr:hypothetical protein [Bacteroidales bacterium]
MKYSGFFLAVILMSLFSCKDNQRRNLDINTDDVAMESVKIKRYEKALFAIGPNKMKPGLKAIAPDFPVFLGADLNDTLNLIQLKQFVNSPLNRMLYDSVIAEFPNLNFLEEEMTKAFKRFKYYFPEKNLPDVFSYVSGLLYEIPIQFFNNDMIIALDMYLGKEMEAYRKMRLPLYKIQNMNRSHIVRDVMYELYFYYFSEKPGKDFLQLMINNGKHLYFLDAVLPKTADHVKIAYTAEKANWCVENEIRIWSFIIENDLIYSSDSNVNRKFFADGPFTSDFSSDSPARIGEWIGWQIVRAYMNNNPEITLQQLLEEQDAQKILKNSTYKPRA